MRTFESCKTRAAVQFILQAILLCVVAFFYVKFYYAFRKVDGTILHRVRVCLKPALFLAAASAVWFFNWIAASVKYSRIKKYFGRYFGLFLGRLFLFLEFVGYVLVIVFLFI